MEKKQYHFIKEIYEQPEVIFNTLTYLDSRVSELAESYANRIERVLLVGCGDPYMIGKAGAYALEMWAKIPAYAIEAAEFSMFRRLADEKTLVFLISSSGKTVKVIESARIAKQLGAPMIALTNLVPSPITEETELVLQTQAGWSDSFPTKQTTTALAVLYAFALYLAKFKNIMPDEKINILKNELYHRVPEMVAATLKLDSDMEILAQEWLEAPIYSFIGSGTNLVTAMLGAAKMKETSQSRSEYSNLEEYAHLHCLSLNEKDPVFIITEPGTMGERNRLVCEHIKINGGIVGVVGPSTEMALWNKIGVSYFEVPDHNAMFGPLISWVPLQLFAYHTAVGKNRNPDRPPQHGPMDYLQKIIYTSMLEGWENR